MSSIKQKKISELIREELSSVFQKKNIGIQKGGMVTITQVDLSPDLLEAIIFVSIFNIKDVEKVLDGINEMSHELRGLLGNKIRNQVRRIPELHFKLDDTLDNVFRLEEIFKKIKK